MVLLSLIDHHPAPSVVARLLGLSGRALYDAKIMHAVRCTRLKIEDTSRAMSSSALWSGYPIYDS